MTFADWLRTIPGLSVEPSDADGTRVLVWAHANHTDPSDVGGGFVDEIFRQVADGEVAVLVDASRETGSSVGGAALAYRAGHDNLLKLSIGDIAEHSRW